VLAAVLWLMVSGMISTGNESKTTMNLASPAMTQQSRGAPLQACWDTTLNINKLTPSDVKVLWSELKISVKSVSGSVLYSQNSPAVDTGVYANDFVVRTWYVETGANTQLNAGDAIKITSMGNGVSPLGLADYQGALIEFYKGGQLIGAANLPTNFP
jgi:hypothetical protein